MNTVAPHWYVRFDDQQYGPFQSAQMQAFVAEGRVIASSLITPDPNRGFFEASAFPAFAQWQGLHVNQQHASVTMPVAVGQSHYSQPDRAIQQPSTNPSKQEAVLLVMAEIQSGQDMPFLTALQTAGSAQRIGDTVWLLRGRLTADQLCQHLQQNLTKQDRLFILDSFKNEKAWFNIGADMGNRIQRIWATQ